MKVDLINATPIEIALEAGLICTDSESRIGEYDATEFISKLVDQGHESVIEHINYNFRVEGISRAVLQELARHRHISLSVKSTRWALKKFADTIEYHKPNTDKLNESQIHFINTVLDIQTESLNHALIEGVNLGIPNDILKYYITESMATKLILTLNARELKHIFNLRTSNRALKEFRDFCHDLYESLPEEHKFIYKSVYKPTDYS